MQKIPTMFRRSSEGNSRHVLPVLVAGCEWVLDGEGVATRKYDGTCCCLTDPGTSTRAGVWLSRRSIRADKVAPPWFVHVETDDTGKQIGWEPIARSPFAKFHAEALANAGADHEWTPGTYELCGPKINANREHLPEHRLIAHATAEHVSVFARTFEDIRACVLENHDLFGVEGIVFHHPDGRMAKIKARDFAREAQATA